MYGGLIKSILYNFLNKLRNKFGQEDNLTENQGGIKYIGIITYYLITINIPVKDTKTSYQYDTILLCANKWTRLDIYLRAPFLCTQVRSLALQDHTQIGRVIGYLKNTV